MKFKKIKPSLAQWMNSRADDAYHAIKEILDVMDNVEEAPEHCNWGFLQYLCGQSISHITTISDELTCMATE